MRAIIAFVVLVGAGCAAQEFPPPILPGAPPIFAGIMTNTLPPLETDATTNSVYQVRCRACGKVQKLKPDVISSGGGYSVTNGPITGTINGRTLTFTCKNAKCPGKKVVLYQFTAQDEVFTPSDPKAKLVEKDPHKGQ